mgnify:CR=1 FL=1
MSIENLKIDLQSLANKHFKNSLVIVRKASLSDNLYFINLCLISKKEDQVCGYFENDPLNVLFSVEYLKSDDVIVEFISSSLSVEPEIGSYLAFRSVKIPTRKFTCENDKFIQKIDKYFQKVSKTVNENKDNMKLDKHIVEKYVGE